MVGSHDKNHQTRTKTKNKKKTQMIQLTSLKYKKKTKKTAILHVYSSFTLSKVYAMDLHNGQSTMPLIHLC